MGFALSQFPAANTFLTAINFSLAASERLIQSPVRSFGASGLKICRQHNTAARFVTSAILTSSVSRRLFLFMSLIFSCSFRRYSMIFFFFCSCNTRFFSFSQTFILIANCVQQIVSYSRREAPCLLALQHGNTAPCQYCRRVSWKSFVDPWKYMDLGSRSVDDGRATILWR